MRTPSYRGPWSLTVVIMTSLVVVFLLQCIDDAYLHTPVQSWLALTGPGIRSGWLWQLLTFQFLHGGFFHLLGNMLGLWYLGRYLENILGRGRFLLAYLGSGALGGVLQGILMLLFPGHYGGAMFGASAGVAGLLAIFGMLQGNAVLMLNFFIPVRARTFLIFFGAMSLFFTIVPIQGDHTAHAAHLGGLIAGYAFFRLGWHHDYQPLPGRRLLESLQNLFRRRPRSSRVSGGRTSQITSASAIELDDDPAFISRRVDPILDKISAHGIHSLTAEERRILEKARSQMTKR
jgi:membrane associated rhomboid family serine protease